MLEFLLFVVWPTFSVLFTLAAWHFGKWLVRKMKAFRERRRSLES